MTKLWLEQNPTLVFRLPSPEEDDDDAVDDVHAENPLQERRVASQKGDGAHPLAANPTRAWRDLFPSIEERDDDDAAHAEGPIRVQRTASLEDKDSHARPPASDPARVWRAPSPIDDDDEDSGDDDDASAAPLLLPPTGPSAAGNKNRHVRRNPPRVVREVRMGRHIVTNPGDTESVSEDLIVSRGGCMEMKGTGVEKEGAGTKRKLRRRRRAKKISASEVEAAAGM